MAYSSTITAFAQSVYLAVKNRYFDEIADDDGQAYIAQVLDWTNQYLDELETVVDSMGQPVAWNWLRTPDFNLGASVAGDTSLPLNASVRELIASPKRPVQIVVGDDVVSSWTVVNPSQMRRNTWDNQVAKVGSLLVFSRPLKESEDAGQVQGDILGSIPRMAELEESALTLVKPRQLLVLGVAKNSSLPDIVQGGLSPSFVQKYNDLLQAAILFNNATADADFVEYDDFSNIGGVGF